MTFKGGLLLARPMLKLFFRAKIFKYEIGPKIGVFSIKRGCNVKFWFYDPKKAYSCTESRLLTYFASKFMRASWLWAELRTQKIESKQFSARSHACAETKPIILSGQILPDGRYPDVITYAKCGDDRLRGLGMAGYKTFAIPHRLLLSSLQHSRTDCCHVL